jgi:hypothetical protein
MCVANSQRSSRGRINLSKMFPASCRKVRAGPELQAGSLRSPKFCHYARTGTLAVRSSLPQLTHAPFTARRIAFQMQ